jgi:predicted ATPase
VWERPEVFGAAACLSPAFSAATLAQVAAAAALGDGTAKRLQHARIYIDNGGDADGKSVYVGICGMVKTGWVLE